MPPRKSTKKEQGEEQENNIETKSNSSDCSPKKVTKKREPKAPKKETKTTKKNKEPKVEKEKDEEIEEIKEAQKEETKLKVEDKKDDTNWEVDSNDSLDEKLFNGHLITKDSKESIDNNDIQSNSEYVESEPEKNNQNQFKKNFNNRNNQYNQHNQHNHQKKNASKNTDSAINFGYNEYRQLKTEADQLSLEDLIKIGIVKAHDEKKIPAREVLKQTLRALKFECNFPEARESHPMKDYSQETKFGGKNNTYKPYRMSNNASNSNHKFKSFTPKPRFGGRQSPTLSE
jgi:hypothetical protein